MSVHIMHNCFATNIIVNIKLSVHKGCIQHNISPALKPQFIYMQVIAIRIYNMS